jgi:hypothetical protein
VVNLPLLDWPRRDVPKDPKYSLWTIDAGGGGAAQISPLRLSYGFGNDYLAYVFGSRVYWWADQLDEDGSVVSCALDGGDLRTEVTLDGFTGLETDLAQFVSGFYYWLNQPR